MQHNNPGPTATGHIISGVADLWHSRINQLTRLDFLAPLAFRLYLAPVMWMAGSSKIAHFDNTVAWFDQGLGLPQPALMAGLAAATETVGAIGLLMGLGVRLMALPMMVTMAVAAVTVHWDNGWLAIAGSDGIFATERTRAAVDKLTAARSLLQEHGDYRWLTEHGPLVVLNNGIEFAVTYFIMLLSLFFTGAGKYASIDYWIARQATSKSIIHPVQSQPRDDIENH